MSTKGYTKSTIYIILPAYEYCSVRESLTHTHERDSMHNSTASQACYLLIKVNMISLECTLCMCRVVAGGFLCHMRNIKWDIFMSLTCMD